MSSKFGFILVKPQLGENIGACARAMKNFGFSKLHIVEPKINFPNHKAKATSVGAYDIINKAKVFNNIQDAMEPFKDQRRDLRSSYDENNWLSKEEMRTAVRAYRLLRQDADIEQLTECYKNIKRKVGNLADV